MPAMANLFTDSSTEKVHVPSEPSIGPDIEEINEKALLRKIDAKLLPAVGVLYLLSFLDRSNGKPTNTPSSSSWKESSN